MEKLYNEKIIDNKYIFHYNFVECNFISEFKITDFNASKIREELLPLLIDKMARINSIRTNKFGWFDLSKDEFIGTQSSWQDYLKLDLDWHLSELSKYYLFTDCDRKFFIKCLELCNCDDPRLLHGDLNDKNILITDRLKVELIDWETALSGDPIYDLAFLCTFTWAQEYSNHIISLYGQMTYIERPDFSFRFWTYFLRISIAKFLILKQNGITDLSRAIDRIDHSLSQLMSYA
jgi:thiamine kinase-like enzyme